MDVLDAIKERRSTRVFLDKPLERETLESLLTLAAQRGAGLLHAIEVHRRPWPRQLLTYSLGN